MTTYAEAQAGAKRAQLQTADGHPITAGAQIWTPGLSAGQVVEVAHSMDEVAPGEFEPWHLVKLDTGCVTAYPSGLLYGLPPVSNLTA